MTGPRSIEMPDPQARALAAEHLNRLTKPPGSLGRLEELVIWAAGVQGVDTPKPFRSARLVIFAGDHGVAHRSSAYPPDVTAQMVANFVTGGAAANVLADRFDVGLRVVDVCVNSDYGGLPVPTEVHEHRIRRSNRAIDIEDAVTDDESVAALALGRACADREIDGGADLLIAGDMGIGNTTPAAAMIARLTDTDVVTVCGRGTGIDDATWMRKVTCLRDALWRTRMAPSERVLASLGGADLAAIAGFVLQAATRRTPVILDGVVVTSAALAGSRLEPDAVAWWLAGHESAEPAHAIALDALALTPLLRLQMRLGEGTGALEAFGVLQSALDLATGMATFESAAVSGRVSD